MTEEEKKMQDAVDKEIIKRVVLVLIIVLAVYMNYVGVELAVAEGTLIFSDSVRQHMENITGIEDIKVRNVRFERYTDTTRSKVYLAYISASSRSMASYADAQPGSEEAKQLLFAMRKVYSAVYGGRICDYIGDLDGVIVIPAYDDHVVLKAKWHSYYYQRGGAGPELLKIDGKVVYGGKKK